MRRNKAGNHRLLEARGVELDANDALRLVEGNPPDAVNFAQLSRARMVACVGGVW